MYAWLSVSVGATLGAWLRWQLGLYLNGPSYLAWGTLAANALGGFLIGIVLAVVVANPHLSVEWRLFLITGFLGGLTTFSSFSAEAFILMQKQLLYWACVHVVSHVLLSICLTFVGYWLMSRLLTH